MSFECVRRVQLEYAEPLQVVHYTVGQEYRKHWDAYDTHTMRGQKHIGTDGNRILTALGYINTVADGTGVRYHQDILLVRTGVTRGYRVS